MTTWRLVGISTLALMLAACGGDGSDDGASAEATGILRAGGVAGVHYATATRSGTTDATGTFRYLPGESVSFSIGGIELGSAPGASEISPFTLAGLTPPTTELGLRRELDRTSRIATPLGRAINIATLLIALDADHNPANGIDVSSKTGALADVQLDVGLPIGPFTSILQRRVPDLTANVPRSYSLAYLYRALNIRVAVHADTRAETYFPGATVPSITSNAYGPDGSHASQSFDSNDDDVPEALSSWTYDSVGRIKSIAQRFPANGFGPYSRDLNFEFDARGIRTLSVEDYRYDFLDGNVLEYQYVSRSATDAYSFPLSEIVDGDLNKDGTADARYTTTYAYDGRHNGTSQKIEADFELDGIPNETVTYTAGYDNLDRMTALLLEFDRDADGAADERYESHFEYEGGPGAVLETGTQDYDADGVVDGRYVINSTYDRANYLRTRVQERDDDGDGVVDGRYRDVFTHDEQQRPLMQESAADYDGDGVFENVIRVAYDFDGAGNLLTSRIEYLSPASGDVDPTSTEAFRYGPGGELIGATTHSVTSGAVDFAQDTTTTVTSIEVPDGVLLLAQRYLERFPGVVANYPGGSGYVAAAAAYTDGVATSRKAGIVTPLGAAY